MKSAVQVYRDNEYAMACGDRDTVVQAIKDARKEVQLACRAAVEKQLIHGALSL